MTVQISTLILQIAENSVSSFLKEGTGGFRMREISTSLYRTVLSIKFTSQSNSEITQSRS